ncbi:hypothetical protein D0Z07_1377 [Hyphodiscus hymeniophilus]|uniref:Uncharacterized protein n=1 Tax=Hyphodiscus hymeniophilus TaxID=353542 RepID=A0A9P6VRS1_9HELO|nr:hypothetical protein D0Z07_1377 [Hyphodiscus hymeniophilus]
MASSTAPGENFEVRQTSASDDWHPDPSKSIPLDKARQDLVNDILALYSCEPTIERSWTFKIIPKTATINALVTLSLDPETVHSDFIRVKYHKDQANDKDYSHEGVGFSFKKWQADQVAKHMDSKEVAAFEADKNAGKEHVSKYGDGKGQAPEKNL